MMRSKVFAALLGLATIGTAVVVRRLWIAALALAAVEEP
jgi:hypothetical protein